MNNPKSKGFVGSLESFEIFVNLELWFYITFLRTVGLFIKISGIGNFGNIGNLY